MKTSTTISTAVALLAMLGAGIPSRADDKAMQCPMMGQHDHGKAGDKKPEMAAGIAELDRLLGEMNNATGEKKIDAMAAVVAKLVEQHKAIHQPVAASLDVSAREEPAGSPQPAPHTH